MDHRIWSSRDGLSCELLLFSTQIRLCQNRFDLKRLYAKFVLVIFRYSQNFGYSVYFSLKCLLSIYALQKINDRQGIVYAVFEDNISNTRKQCLRVF